MSFITLLSVLQKYAKMYMLSHTNGRKASSWLTREYRFSQPLERSPWNQKYIVYHGPDYSIMVRNVPFLFEQTTK